MRLLTILFVLLGSFSFAQVLDQKVDQWSCESELVECLKQLEASHQLRFAFKQENLQGLYFKDTLVNTTVKSLIEAICAANDLEYSVFDGNIITLKPIYRPLDRTVICRLTNAANGEVIANALVFYPETGFTTYTDPFGYFRLRTDKDSVYIEVIKEGFQLLRIELLGRSFTHYALSMVPIHQFAEVEVKAGDSLQAQLPSHAYEKIEPSSHPLPTFGGETDALSNMRLTGGIQNVGLGDPGLVVRGGGPDQNFILIDGIPVYNTFHILGLYSIFNSSTINQIKFYKDAFPSKYGSRLSSVVDVHLNNGNKQKLSGDADVGIISSGLSLNGPLVKDKLSFSIAGRRSYADLLTYPAQKMLNRNKVQENTTGLWYYDVFGKLHWQINKDHQLKLTLYNGGDEFNFTSKLDLLDDNNTTEQTSADLRWRNRLVGLQYHGVINPSLFVTFQSAYSAYEMGFGDAYRFEQKDNIQANTSNYLSGLNELRNSLDFDHFSGGTNHFLFGVGHVRYSFEPFEQSYTSEGNFSVTDTSFRSSQINTQEFYGYVEDNIYLPNGLLSVGLRLSQFISGERKYFNIQPRIFLSKNLSKRLQFKFSITDMAQFLHLLPNNNLGLPIDIWLPVTEDIEPLQSFQISTGLKYVENELSVAASIFAKNYRYLIEHRSGNNFLSGSGHWQDQVVVGTGSSFGMELQANYNIDDFNLMGAYTYCRSTRVFDQINSGGNFFSKYDRPHSLNLFGEYALSHRTSVMASFTYASGNPITIPTSRFVTVIGGKEIIVEEFSEVNNYRLPATHHLDVAYKTKRQYKRFDSELLMGVYNIYNQLNPFMVYIGLDEKIEPVLKLRSYLPIMPMLKYRINF